MASSSESESLPSQETTMIQIPSSVSQESESKSSRRECPICYHVLPFDATEHIYHDCCGRLICDGCVIGKQRTQLKEPQPQFKDLGKIIEGTTPEVEQFRLIKKHGNNIYVCPYCRAPLPKREEESLQRLYTRIEIHNDRDYTIAVNLLGMYFEKGQCGLPQNLKKAEELYKEACDLGEPDAAWNLVVLYRNHYSDQKKNAEIEYLQRGDMLGSVNCIQELAYEARDSGNEEEFARLWLKSVRLGGDEVNLWWFYRRNLISKDVIATTLRANQAIKDEVKTKRRSFAQRYQEYRKINA